MRRTHNCILAGLAATTLLAAGTALAREELRPSQDKVAIGQEEVKRLLPLMADENGKVSEQAFMEYMRAEFGSFNKDEEGRVDVRKVANHSSNRPVTFSAVGR